MTFRKNESSCLLAVFLVLFATAGCKESRNSATADSDLKNSASAKLFPSDRVCDYPSRSSIPKFRGLGGGTWRYRKVGSSDLDHDCGIAETNILLKGGTNAFIEYGVVGTAQGAASIGFDYSVQELSIGEIELRKEFTVLLDEVTKEALNVPLPDAVKSKIMDVKTYKRLGERNEEVFTLGEGRLELSLNANPYTTILIKTSICPDKNIDCP